MQDIRGTIFNITKSVKKSSGDFYKSTKLNMSLSSEEAALKALHYEIGKKVHEIYQYGGSLGKFFDEKYLEIEACERKIAEIKDQISVIKGTKPCTKCGKTLEISAEFCHKCGIRVELGHAHTEDTGMAANTAIEAGMMPSARIGVSDDVVDELDRALAGLPPLPNEHETTVNTTHTMIPDTTITPPPAAAPSPSPSLSVRICRVCSSQNEAGKKFCLSCGRILD